MTPKFRQSLYYLSTVALALLGLVQVWHGVDAGVAENLSTVIPGLGTLFGSAAPAVAAAKVASQRADGTFESAAPAQQVINGVQAVLEAKAAAEAEVAKVKAAVSDVVAAVPSLGPLAQQILR